MLIPLLAACSAPQVDLPRPDPGTDPTAPVTPPATTAPEPPDPEPEARAGAHLLETDEVRAVEITIGAAEYASLQVSPDDWVPADILVDGEAVQEVAVRLKGNGSFQPIGGKPSFKIDLDRYVEDNALDGLDDLVLNNMVLDPSYLRERLAYLAYRELGVPAPRAAHVQVWVNGQAYGLYLLLEDVDGKFLDQWFEDDDGPLYEMFDVDFTAEQVWQFEHDGGPDDRTALLGLSGVLADPEARVSVEGAEWLDLDSFAAYFGASALVGQFDAYPYSYPGDDVYLYVHPDDGRIRFLAHGGDETFGDAFRPVDYVYGMLGVGCLADVACEDQWEYEVWSSLLDLEDLDLAAFLDGWADDLRPHVALEWRSGWTQTETDSAQAAVRDFVTTRRERLEAMPGL